MSSYENKGRKIKRIKQNSFRGLSKKEYILTFFAINSQLCKRYIAENYTNSSWCGFL